MVGFGTRPRAPIIVTQGTNEAPEFQRRNREFAAAARPQTAGRPHRGPELNHFETAESPGNSYAPNGRAALDPVILERIAATP